MHKTFSVFYVENIETILQMLSWGKGLIELWYEL